MTENKQFGNSEQLDTISRQAAIDAINQICPIDTEYDCTLLDRVDVRCVLTDLPSAQPERKRGHWIEVNDSYNRIRGRCSVCGWESHMYEDDVVGMNYCPNCGAKQGR